MPGAFCGPDDGRQGRGLGAACVPSAPPGIMVLGRFNAVFGANRSLGAHGRRILVNATAISAPNLVWRDEFYHALDGLAPIGVTRQNHS